MRSKEGLPNDRRLWGEAECCCGRVEGEPKSVMLGDEAEAV